MSVWILLSLLSPNTQCVVDLGAAHCVCVFVLTHRRLCTPWGPAPGWPGSRFGGVCLNVVVFLCTHKLIPSDKHKQLSSGFLLLFLLFFHLRQRLTFYLILLSVRPSPCPRKVAMETEADLMQGHGMNYTVSEAVCVCAEFFSFFKGFQAPWLALTVEHECDRCVYALCSCVRMFAGDPLLFRHDVISYFRLCINNMWSFFYCGHMHTLWTMDIEFSLGVVVIIKKISLFNLFFFCFKQKLCFLY